MKKTVSSLAFLSVILFTPVLLSAQAENSLAAQGSSTTKKFIDPANMDLSVKPGDNFYQYANGTWLKKTPIPGSKTRWGSADALSEESSQALKVLLEEAAKSPGSNSLM